MVAGVPEFELEFRFGEGMMPPLPPLLVTVSRVGVEAIEFIKKPDPARAGIATFVGEEATAKL